MHPITIKIEDTTYDVVRLNAERLGFLSVEEYVSDWLENDAAFEISMTPKLAQALEEGIADSREGKILSLDELNRRHEEYKAAWIKAHQT